MAVYWMPDIGYIGYWILPIYIANGQWNNIALV
jgi:hypothetical protein